METAEVNFKAINKHTGLEVQVLYLIDYKSPEQLVLICTGGRFEVLWLNDLEYAGEL